MQSEGNIKEFEIISKLGEGSFSMVYKVKRLSDGKLYAMKKVKMALLSQKERENALNEIRILASLQSPYIVQYRDSFLDIESNILCVIMELALGGDLTKLVNEGKFKGGVEEAEIWRALTQMTLGLKNLHDLKILHRDLKCANVFTQTSPEGNIYKLGDLNISKVTKGIDAKTQAGTPYYASPEVWKGNPYSSPCDIWSLGCIVYELACGRPPFRANDLQGLNKKIQLGVFDPIPTKYSKDLTTILTKMLKVNPSARSTCNEILTHPIIKSGGILPANDTSSNNKEQLLKTIKLPRNLQLLKGNLPKAQYDDQIQCQRSSSAGPRKMDIAVLQTPQPEKKEYQQQYLQNPMKTPQNPKPPMQNKPPMSQKQDYNSLQQKAQIDQQRISSQQQNSQVSDRYSNQRQQSTSQTRGSQQQGQQRPAGAPSGMGRRQVSAHQVGKR